MNNRTNNNTFSITSSKHNHTKQGTHTHKAFGENFPRIFWEFSLSLLPSTIHYTMKLLLNSSIFLQNDWILLLEFSRHFSQFFRIFSEFSDDFQEKARYYVMVLAFTTITKFSSHVSAKTSQRKHQYRSRLSLMSTVTCTLISSWDPSPL